MKCVHCGRSLSIATVSVEASGTTYHYGPKCAARAGLLATVARAVRAAKGRAAPLFRRRPSRLVDEQQLLLTLEYGE